MKYEELENKISTKLEEINNACYQWAKSNNILIEINFEFQFKCGEIEYYNCTRYPNKGEKMK